MSGPLSLMTEFLPPAQKRPPIKAAALRQAQLALLEGRVRITDGRLQLPKHAPPFHSPQVPIKHLRAYPIPTIGLHFTVVGNWN